MIIDIVVAFLYALMLEINTFKNKRLKMAAVFVSCATAVMSYYFNHSEFNPIIDMDAGVWIMFVIMFDILVELAIEKIIKHIKE